MAEEKKLCVFNHFQRFGHFLLSTFYYYIIRVVNLNAHDDPIQYSKEPFTWITNRAIIVHWLFNEYFISRKFKKEKNPEWFIQLMNWLRFNNELVQSMGNKSNQILWNTERNFVAYLCIGNRHIGISAHRMCNV